MNLSKTLLSTAFALLLSSPAWAQSSGPAISEPGKQSVDKLIDLIIQREQNEIAAFSLYKPIIETYLQELKPDKDMGFMPERDDYFLGQVDLKRGVAIGSLLRRHGGLLPFRYDSSDRWIPQGFLEMIYVDHRNFDKQHYDFHYRGKDFLGEVRCLVFDVSPSRKSGKNRFKGRIWVEDRDYTIVRFNGVNMPQRNFAHFDSWRLNVQPDLWLPTYVFSEELNPKKSLTPRFKGQTRFWAYNVKSANREDEFSDLFIDPQNQVQDDSSRAEQDPSPVQAEREFRREGEENAVDTLEKDGLVAPEGGVEKVLNTVLNNLEVTNNLTIEPEPHCRVLLTSNIEMFSIGHTIVLSRGLLDVLPDEATLAAMLAQGLADAMILNPAIDQYEFSDVLQTSTRDAMKDFSFRDNQQDWQAASTKAIELLRNSPYRGKMGTAALFFQQLNRESKLLPHLISPHLGNRVYPIAELMNSGPTLRPTDLDQIAALPMGSRIKLDVWNDQIQMANAKQVALLSAREKMPFEVTPFMPYLTRYKAAESQMKTGLTDQAAAQSIDDQKVQ